MVMGPDRLIKSIIENIITTEIQFLFVFLALQFKP